MRWRRRWSWISAAVMGFLIGPAPVTADPDDDPIETERTEEPTTGHAIGGVSFYVWDEDSRAADEWAFTLAQSAHERTRWARWRAIAERTAVLPSAPVDEHDLAFAMRVAALGGRSELTPLGRWLCMLPTLDRTYLIASLATSSDDAIRLALARALAAPFRAVGADGAIGYLREDSRAEIARQARSAAAARAELLG
jgi:hypothetical protein